MMRMRFGGWWFRLRGRWKAGLKGDGLYKFWRATPFLPTGVTWVVSSSVGVVVLFGGITLCRHKRTVQQRWHESSCPWPSWNRSITRKPRSRQVTKFYFAKIKQLLNINPRKEKTKKRKKEKRRCLARNVRVFANLHRNESNLLSPMRKARFYMQVILSFF